MEKMKHLIFTLLLFTSSTAFSESYISGKVIDVSDGDTATIRLDNNDTVEIRFYGVDTPEKEFAGRWEAQADWELSRDFVSNMILNKKVTVRLTGAETYSRKVGEIFHNGYSVSRELLRNGLAWWYEKYASKDVDLFTLHSHARLEGIGIWQNPDVMPPWEHRRGN